jgi:hypothetical protein
MTDGHECRENHDGNNDLAYPQHVTTIAIDPMTATPTAQPNSLRLVLLFELSPLILIAVLKEVCGVRTR